MLNTEPSFFILVMVSILTAVSVVNVFSIVSSINQAKNILAPWPLILTSFLIAYPMSGIIHLLNLKNISRGFNDLLTSNNSEFYILYSVALVVVAYISLIFGKYWKNNNDSTQYLISQKIFYTKTSLIFLFAIFFIILGSFGVLMSASTSEFGFFNALTTLDRAREIDIGFAKFFFISRWLSWGVLFLFYALTSIHLFNIKYVRISLIILAILISLLNLYASGGRSEALLSILPIIYLTIVTNPKLKKPITLATLLLLIFYMLNVTTQRNVDYTEVSVVNILGDLIDWQLGRFSTIALAFDFTNNYGFNYGATIISGISDVINLFLKLFIDYKIDFFKAITYYTGDYILGDYTKTGIVPGSICDLYFNFGIFGVVVGYFFLARFINYLNLKINLTRSLGAFCTYYYLVILLVVTFIPGTASAFMQYLVSFAFPPILLMLYDKFKRIS